MKHVPLNADAAEVLEDQLQSRSESGIYVFPGRNGKKIPSIKTAWNKALKRAGIPPRCRFHDLRHTGISRMVVVEILEVSIGCMAGWTDSSAPIMLRRYGRLTGNYLQEAAKALERGRRKHKLSTSYEKAHQGEGVDNAVTT